jgi:hypothetical protein
MATGMSAALANELLDALCNADAYSAPAVHIQLHVGDPGAAGTSNVATETDRVQASFSAAASGAITNDAALEWTGVAGAEDYTYYSAWTAAAAGTFLFSGVMTANAVLAGDTFRIPVGDLDLSFPIAS